MRMHKNVNSNTVKAPQIAPQKKRSKAIKFTDFTIKSLKSNRKKKVFWCQGLSGFCVRVTPKGTKTWIYAYRFKNVPYQIKMVLGRYPEVSLQEARQLYLDALDKVKRGINPVEVRKQQRQEEQEAETVKQLSEKYIEYCKARGEVSWKEKERVLNKEFLPIIGHLKVYEVTFKHIAKIVNAIFTDRGTAVQAQRALSHARCMFKFAKNGLGLIEINPCADLEAPKKKKKPKRALSTKDIYLFWNNMDYTLMTPVVTLGLKFMLCTLARGIEVRKMKWANINFEDKTWFIPPEDAKNGREILLPLNKYAIKILEDVKEITGHSELVFGHHPTMNYGVLIKKYDLSVMGSTAFSHALRDNFELLNIKEKFTPHDLRRSAATCLTSVSYPKEWVSKLLNHTPKDITSMVYDVFDYFEEKKAGMKSIEYILDRILSSKNADLVPSLRVIRKEFLSQKLIYKFLDETNFEDQKPLNSSQGLQATFSNPVTYKLSVCRNGLGSVA